MAWILTGILTIAVIILIIKYNQKVIIDKTAKNKYQLEIKQLKASKQELRDSINELGQEFNEYQNKISIIQQQYKQELSKKTEDLNLYFNEQKKLRQSELDSLFKARQAELEATYLQVEQQCDKAIRTAESNAEQLIAQADSRAEQIKEQVDFEAKRYQDLIAPLKQYEMDKQQRLFYTIQVPDEYKEDIDFLLNTVSQKVRHPDIINKLVWAEYVKPYLDDTFKRIEIRAEPGIYKLTNIENGKAYIGKSTDVKKRISDHMKSTIGIQSIADQAVHHAILETGFWNWTIEVITYCDKDKLSELERYYINFFKTQEYGFNKNAGGGG